MSVQIANGFIANNSKVGFYEWIDEKITYGLKKVRSNIKYGLANVAGEIICPCDYDEIQAINDNCFKVRKGNLWGVVDSNGEKICPCKHLNIIEVAANGVYSWVDDDVYFIKL